IDKVRNNQVVGFRDLESDKGTYQTGLEMWQQTNVPSDVLDAKKESIRKMPDESARKAAYQVMVDNNELSTQRLFLGKRRDNSTEFLMSDIKGRPRIRMVVNADGTPKLDFLDQAGKVIYSLPEDKKAVQKQ